MTCGNIRWEEYWKRGGLQPTQCKSIENLRDEDGLLWVTQPGWKGKERTVLFEGFFLGDLFCLCYPTCHSASGDKSTKSFVVVILNAIWIENPASEPYLVWNPFFRVLFQSLVNSQVDHLRKASPSFLDGQLDGFRWHGLMINERWSVEL